MINIFELLMRLRDYPEQDVNVLIRRYHEDKTYEVSFRWMPDIEKFLVKNIKAKYGEVVDRKRLLSDLRNDLFAAEFPKPKFVKEEDEIPFSNLQIVKNPKTI